MHAEYGPRTEMNNSNTLARAPQVGLRLHADCVRRENSGTPLGPDTSVPKHPAMRAKRNDIDVQFDSIMLDASQTPYDRKASDPGVEPA